MVFMVIFKAAFQLACEIGNIEIIKILVTNNQLDINNLHVQ